MISITSASSILLAGIVMGIMYFIMEYDWSYWAYVGIYTGVYTIGLFIEVALEISLMNSFIMEMYFGKIFTSYIIYIVSNIICFALIGMVVVYALNSLKNSEKKTFVAVGIILQLVMTIFIQQLLGNIVNF